MNTFTVSPKSILSALTLVSKAILKNAVVPIIENYLFQVTGNRLVISATDLQTTFRAFIPISDIRHAVETFSFVVPRTIIKYLQKVDSEFVTFEYIYEKTERKDRQGNTVKDKLGKIEYDHLCKLLVDDSDGRANYSCEYYLDFPKSPTCDQLAMEIQPALISEFKDLLNYTSGDQLRPAMTGIFFGMKDKKPTLCATDGHRLKTVDVNDFVGSSTAIEAQENGQVFILPERPAKILSSLKIKDSLLVSFKRTEKKDVDGKNAGYGDVENVMFTGTVDGIIFELIARSIDERFPDYSAVIPQGDGLTRLTLNKKSFTKIIDKALLFANKTSHQVRISLNGKNLLSAEDLDFNHEFNGVIPDSAYSGDELEIGFNGEFLKECIANVSDTFTLDMWKPNKAGVIRDGRSTVLCMPVMLHQYETPTASKLASDLREARENARQ